MRLPDSISRGKHESPTEGMCVMETVAYIAREPHTDHPECASEVITRFAIATNDAMPDDATRTRYLAPLVWRIAGTRRDAALEQRLAYECADWAVREVAPVALRTAGLDGEADKLEALPPIRSVGTAKSAHAAAAAAYAAYAAYAADAAITAATWDRWGSQVGLLARLCDIAHAWDGEARNG